MSLSETTKEALDFNLPDAERAELHEGYFDGFRGEPKPGDNRTDWLC